MWLDAIPLVTRQVAVRPLFKPALALLAAGVLRGGACRTVFGACVSLYALSALTGLDDVGPVCLNPYTLINKLQLYRRARPSSPVHVTAATCEHAGVLRSHNIAARSCRLVTSAFVHVSVLHVAFNMLAFVPIGCSMERQLGSLQFASIILLLILVGEAFYISASYTLAFL